MVYTDLDVWIESRKLVTMIYQLTMQFPKDELYGLTNQIRRCSISVPSNIAEGSGRNSTNDTLKFLFISRGSLFELETQIYLSLDLKFIKCQDFDEIINQITTCKKLLNGFINYQKTLLK